MGGLDLCFGRFDTHSHKIVDPSNEMNQYNFPGIDYYNMYQGDFKDVKKYEESVVNRNETPRMGWHDIGIRLEGEVVLDLSRHFIQYWNFANIDKGIRDNKMSFQRNPTCGMEQQATKEE